MFTYCHNGIIFIYIFLLSVTVNVSIQFNNISTPNEYVMTTSCQSSYVNATVIKISVELMENNDKVNETTVNCSEIFEFVSLKECSLYEIKLQWMTNKGTKCPISHGLIRFSTACNKTDCFLQIVIIQVEVLLLMFVTFLCVAYFWCRIQNRFHRSYSTVRFISCCICNYRILK